jgi:hypothetical protein
VVVAGTLVGIATPNGVAVHDLATRALVTLPGGPELQLASDGDALVAVTTDRAAHSSTVTRMTAGAKPITTRGAELAPVASCVVATAEDLFVMDAKAVSRLALPRLDLVAFHAASRTIDGCARFADGVAYIAGGSELVGLDRTLAPTRIQPGVGALRHIAAAGGRRVWVTSDQGVHLIEFVDGSAQRIHDLALPGVFHAASAGSGLAVLTVTTQAGAWTTLTLTLVGDDGAIKWSKPLPLPTRPTDTAVAANVAHVAVVVDGALHLLATATGTVIKILSDY